MLSCTIGHVECRFMETSTKSHKLGFKWYADGTERLWTPVIFKKSPVNTNATNCNFTKNLASYGNLTTHTTASFNACNGTHLLATTRSDLYKEGAQLNGASKRKSTKSKMSSSSILLKQNCSANKLRRIKKRLCHGTISKSTPFDCLGPGSLSRISEHVKYLAQFYNIRYHCKSNGNASMKKLLLRFYCDGVYNICVWRRILNAYIYVHIHAYT